MNEVSSKEAYSFIVSNIDLLGTTLLSSEEESLLLEPYEESVMSIDRLNQLLKDVTNWYVRRGYISTRAYFVPQNIQGGI